MVEGAAFAVTGTLKPFPSCDTVLQYFKDEAPEDLLNRVGAAMASSTAGAPLERTTVTDQGGDAARPVAPRRAPAHPGTRTRTSRRPASTSRTS